MKQLARAILLAILLGLSGGLALSGCGDDGGSAFAPQGDDPDRRQEGTGAHSISND